MRGSAGRRAALVTLVCALALAGCTGAPTRHTTSTSAAPLPSALSSGWTEIAPPASGARVLTMTTTGRVLLVFGSVPHGSARAPAAWTTTDLTHWTRLATHAVTGYGEVAQFIMGADAAGRIVAYGQAYGGAHSNPRPTTWTGSLRRLDEHEQPYTLFGGEDAIGVTAMAASGQTALISGAWDGPLGYGAAVWLTRDGVRWSRIADAPGLASAQGEQTFAGGATSTSEGFLLTGSTMRGGRTGPLAWRSDDGSHWTRLPLSATTDAQARAAACAEDGCVVVGSTLTPTQRLECWRLNRSGTQTETSEGPGHGLIDVTGVVLAGDRAVVVGAVDHVATLWSVGSDCTAWSEEPMPAGSEDAEAAAFGGRMVLATTTPQASRLWVRAAG